MHGRGGQVRGRRLDTGGAIRTRSRAAAQAEHWDRIPLRLKLFVLTVEALKEEAHTQAPPLPPPGGGGWH